MSDARIDALETLRQELNAKYRFHLSMLDQKEEAGEDVAGERSAVLNDFVADLNEQIDILVGKLIDSDIQQASDTSSQSRNKDMEVAISNQMGHASQYQSSDMQPTISNQLSHTSQSGTRDMQPAMSNPSRNILDDESDAQTFDENDISYSRFQSEENIKKGLNSKPKSILKNSQHGVGLTNKSIQTLDYLNQHNITPHNNTIHFENQEKLNMLVKKLQGIPSDYNEQGTSGPNESQIQNGGSYHAIQYLTNGISRSIQTSLHSLNQHNIKPSDTFDYGGQETSSPNESQIQALVNLLRSSNEEEIEYLESVIREMGGRPPSSVQSRVEERLKYLMQKMKDDIKHITAKRLLADVLRAL